MTRTATTLAVMLALVVVLVAVCLAGPSKALAPTPWAALGESAFRPLVTPLDHPVRPETAPSATIAPEVVSTPKPAATSRPRVSVEIARKSISGVASYYCRPVDYGTGNCMAVHPNGGPYAAAGPALRSAIGAGWRGRSVRVCAGTCVTAILADFCSCRSGRIIDLYEDLFSRLAAPSRGIVEVTVSW